MSKNDSLSEILEKLRIVDGMGGGFSLIDRDFRIRWVNRILQKQYGKNSEIIGKHCYKVYEKRNHICRGCPSKKTFLTGEVHQTIRQGISKNGERRFYKIIANPIKDKDNNVVRVLELAQDITEQVKQNKNQRTQLKNLKKTCTRLNRKNKGLNNNIKCVHSISKKVSKANEALTRKYRMMIKRLNYKQEELNDLLVVNRLVCSSADTSKTISLISKLAKQILHADAVTIRYVDNEKRILIPKCAVGMDKDSLIETPLKIGQGLEGTVAQNNKVLQCKDMRKDERTAYIDRAKENNLRSALFVPAVFNQQNLAVISVFYHDVRDFSEEEIGLMKAFANQLALAIQENRSWRNVHRNYFNTLKALVLAMEARDPFTHGHAERVTRYALDIAHKLQLPRSSLNILQYAGIVHDVGKIGISDLILNKPGRLTAAERAIIELHPIKGVEVLEPLKFLSTGIPLVRHHHERFDGNGYPDRIAKEEIPLSARILACADAFDAMTSDRPYRLKKMKVKDAVAELKVNAGSQFDPKLVPVFINLIKKEKYI